MFLYELKSENEFYFENNQKPKEWKRYFNFKSLNDLILNYNNSNSNSSNVIDGEEENRKLCFIDFLKGLLQFDPNKRWTPKEAMEHPFVKGEKFTQPYIPKKEFTLNFSSNPFQMPIYNTPSNSFNSFITTPFSPTGTTGTTSTTNISNSNSFSSSSNSYTMKSSPKKVYSSSPTSSSSSYNKNYSTSPINQSKNYSSSPTKKNQYQPPNKIYSSSPTSSKNYLNSYKSNNQSNNNGNGSNNSSTNNIGGNSNEFQKKKKSGNNSSNKSSPYGKPPKFPKSKPQEVSPPSNEIDTFFEMEEEEINDDVDNTIKKNSSKSIPIKSKRWKK